LTLSDAIGLVYGVGAVISGVLLVATGQFLNVISLIELNTKKTALITERILEALKYPSRSF